MQYYYVPDYPRGSVHSCDTADVRSKSLKYMEHGAWFRDDGHGSEHYGISIVQPRRWLMICISVWFVCGVAMRWSHRERSDPAFHPLPIVYGLDVSVSASVSLHLHLLEHTEHTE